MRHRLKNVTTTLVFIIHNKPLWTFSTLYLINILIEHGVKWSYTRFVIETKTIEADPENFSEAVAAAVSALETGEIVALPTETVYGLGANAFDADAVAKVFAAKERPSFDPLIVHVGSREAIHEVADIPEDMLSTVNELIQAHWPGPLTLVVPKKSIVPDIVTSGLDTVAVRMSAHPVMKAITKEFGKPIAAPSANKFGCISPTSAWAVSEELKGDIPLIIDGGACLDGLESTIIRVEATGARPRLHLLRPGPVSKEELQKVGKVIRPKKNRPVSEQPEAPGMLDSHYAPATPLYFYDDPSQFIPEPGKMYGLLSYRGQEKDGYLRIHDWDEVQELSPGKGKLAEASVRLFFCMRQLDLSGVDAIIAEPVSEVGLGVAIMDRIRRASVI